MPTCGAWRCTSADHPLDYFDFEGVIPEGQYGGGDVIVWDWGTWNPSTGDPLAAVDAGDLRFDLDGEKLHGHFALVRRGGRSERQWLLVKKHDDAAVGGWDPEQHPQSVKTGRTNDEVKASPSASWSSAAHWTAPSAAELAELDELGDAGKWQFGDHAVSLTKLDQVAIPGTKSRSAVTTRDLVRHYATVAPVVLPHLAGRPVSMHRFPDGVGGRGSWSQAGPSRLPQWVRRWDNDDSESDGPTRSVVFDSPAVLAWAANHGTIELGAAASTTGDLDHPTWALLSIVPEEDGGFDDVLIVARLCRTALEHLGVSARPVVTGTGGIDVWMPVTVGYTFDATRTWVNSLAEAIGGTVPDLVTAERAPGEPARKILLDDTPNTPNATVVTPFSVRPVGGAPVAVPLGWDELDDPDLTATPWTIHDIADRIARSGDPLAPLIGTEQRLPRL